MKWWASYLLYLCSCVAYYCSRSTTSIRILHPCLINVWMSYLRMQRNKGQFTSSKKSDGDYSWGTGQESGQDDSHAETSWVYTLYYRVLFLCTSLFSLPLSLGFIFCFVLVVYFVFCPDARIVEQVRSAHQWCGVGHLVQGLYAMLVGFSGQTGLVFLMID